MHACLELLDSYIEQKTTLIRKRERLGVLEVRLDNLLTEVEICRSFN